ncbi:MAG TPA: response regulator [Candidatus Dormibacteraeota bacterium]
MNMMTLSTAVTSRPNVDPRTEKPIEVLYIQDDANTAELWRLRLELDGYRVRIVSGAAADWTVSAGGVPDLVLIDLLSPDGSGARALTRLRTDRRMRTVPVVLLSGFGRGALRDAGVPIGPFDHVISGPAVPQPVGRSALLDS